MLRFIWQLSNVILTLRRNPQPITLSLLLLIGFLPDVDAASFFDLARSTCSFLIDFNYATAILVTLRLRILGHEGRGLLHWILERQSYIQIRRHVVILHLWVIIVSHMVRANCCWGLILISILYSLIWSETWVPWRCRTRWIRSVHICKRRMRYYLLLCELVISRRRRHCKILEDKLYDWL